MAGQDHRQLGRLPSPIHFIKPTDLLLEHLFVQKKDRAQGLVLGGSGHRSIPCEMGQKLGHLDFGHPVGVPFLVIEDETPNPVGVRLLGPNAEVFSPDGIANLVEQFRLVR